MGPGGPGGPEPGWQQPGPGGHWGGPAPFFNGLGGFLSTW